MSNLINTRLGQYYLIEEIRSGGMATVYKAYQASLDRFVAVKVLHRNLDPTFTPRFKHEARAIAQLQHPNILPVYDYGEESGQLYLVMQYIPNGVTLVDSLDAPMAPTMAVALMERLLAALDYAHARGVIHRDIKPSNILMAAPNWPLLADFGIAKMTNQSQKLTVPGVIMGTAAYMSPEQAAGWPIDARSDLYSAGIVFYQMVTGQVPFDAETPIAILAKHTRVPPPPPRSVNPSVPAAIEAIILRMLEKDPDKRYQSAAEVNTELERVAIQVRQQYTPSQIERIYQTGVHALERGEWSLAIERLTQLITIDPNHSEGAELLEVARQAQERAKMEAQQQLESIRHRHKQDSQPALQAPGAAPSQPIDRRTPKLAPTSDAAPGAPAGAAQPIQPTAPLAPAPAARKSSIVPWTIAGVALVALLLIASRLTGLWPDQRVAINVANGNEPRSTVSTSAGTASAAAATAAPASSQAQPATPPPTAAVTSVPAPEPIGTLVFEDDLNSGPANSGLEDRVSATDFSRGFHAPGVYHFKLANPNELRWTMLPRLAYSNFSLQIELWDNSDSFIGGVAQGIIFRARDHDHFYTLLLDPRGGRYSVRKLDGNDTWTDLIPWKVSPLVKQKAEHNLLRLDADGTTFTVYLNGQSLDTFSDDSYRYGMFGLLTANMDASAPHMHFDNIKVWSNDPAPPASALAPERESPAGAMVLVPGGEFIMGGVEKSDEQAHILDLPDFYLDRTEVTNAAYAQCVAAGACTPQQSPASQTHPNYATQADFANYPAMYVSWQQAFAFCSWAGKRLPTEAEWEKAASWDPKTRQKMNWPLGNTFDATRLNSAESNAGDTTPVGQFAPELNGTLDMAGNVSEWASSLFKPYPYDPNDGREDPQAAGDRVFRGGSWAQTEGKAHGIYRQPAPANYAGREIGFRCAATP